MRLIVVRERQKHYGPGQMDVLRYALSTDLLSRAILTGACRFGCSADDQGDTPEASDWTVLENCTWAFPEHWQGQLSGAFRDSLKYTDQTGVRLKEIPSRCNHPWLVISDGYHATHINGQLFSRVLSELDADIVAVTAEPKLVAYRERIRLAQEGRLVGYRRQYRDSAEPVPMPEDWPHHLFIRSECIDRALPDNLPNKFSDLTALIQSRGLTARALAVAGSVVDLGTAEGLLSLVEMTSACRFRSPTLQHHQPEKPQAIDDSGVEISSESRFVGPVLLGDGVSVGKGAVVVGPSVLCDNCRIGADAVVDSSIVGAGVTLDDGQVLRRTFAIVSQGDSSVAETRLGLRARPILDWACPHRKSVFRSWPRLSYARCFKRIADIVVAATVLLLFAPVIPLIALAVKINSPGPAFFKDKRQGLHGKLFGCIKFRTMHVGAADIQDKLRFVSEVDGPQFKMADDPRISAVGRFLRETYLDEIPQFYNVLCGQMSIVGPRPSPEKENTLCPSWRDARLSVRPGITGFWQVCRTRQPFKDFQEWIFYDTRYVRELSPWVDIKMCWLTFRKMVENFIRQF